MKNILTPYLNFPGQAKEAMEFYHAIFGGDLKLQTFAESGMPIKDEDKDKIIHAELHTDVFVIMASDGNAEHPVHMGDNITMNLSDADGEAMTKYFNGLAEGGQITMPLEKQFWGDTYGQITDKFGVNWSVNIAAPKP